jgi:small-conductance mechanosensitive channel
VQVGDTVEVGTLLGTVRRIGIRSSTVRTFDEAEVIVPNNDLIANHVVNWTLSDQLRRMEVKVGVEYGTDPVQVQEILVKVAREHAKVLEYPAPYALFKGFGDSSLDFVVRFWTSDFGNWIFIASEVTVGIDAALKEAGFTIPFPQRDLHIYSVDPPAPIPDGGRVELPPDKPPADEARPPQADGDGRTGS